MKKGKWQTLPGYPELKLGQYIVPNFVSNSIALDGGSGHWVVLSPGEPLLEDWRQNDGADMTQLSLVLPNHYHYMGANAWVDAYPDARLYASRQAIPRLRKQGLARLTALEDDSPRLPSGYDYFFPPGHRAGDVWVCRAREQGVWITCDSFLNYPRLSNQPLARKLQQWLGAAPGLKMSQVVKWFLLNDRKAFKNWALSHLESYPPVLLIPGHGEPEEDSQLAERLRALLLERL